MSHLEDNSCVVCLPPNDAVFYYFPENLERRLLWIQALGLINVDVDFYCNKQICDRHFSAESYTDCQRRILKETAIPNFTSTIPRYLSCFAPKSIISQSTQHQQLMRLLSNKKRKLYRLKNKAKEYRNNITKLSDLEEMTNGIFKGMSPKMQQFLITQLRQAKLPIKAQTWSVEEQIKSLIFLQKQANGYELLRRLLPLPSPTLLDQLLNKIPFKPGINEKIFEHLRKCLKSYKRKQRICSLVFGEIPLRRCLQYNPSLDTIDGVVDLGRSDRSNSIADRALVFMVQAVAAQWKQPVAYYLTNSQLRSETLEMILRTVLDALQRIGVKVIATICDLNTLNIVTLRRMESTKSDPFFMHNGERVFTIFNPPHLLKATRNHFYKYPIKCVSVPDVLQPDVDDGPLTAYFADVRAMYEFDLGARLKELRFFINHTSEHFGPLKLSTMKLSMATKIFSRNVAAYIFSTHRHVFHQSNDPTIKEKFSETLEGTAIFVMFMDRLFDSFNWISTMKVEYPNYYPLRTPLTNKSKHSQFWTEAYKSIENWTFIGAKRRPLVQDGWLITISAMKGVWQSLQSYGIKKLDTRQLNCDSLDNLFETIRFGCNCTNNKPTVQQFVAGLKVQIVNGLHYDPVDHEKDSFEVLSNLRGFFEAEQVKNTRLLTNDNNFRIVKQIIEDSSTISVVRVSREIARKFENNCVKCKSILSSNIDPSDKLIITVGHGITLTEKILPTILSQMELWKALSNTLSEQLNLSWIYCDLHTTTIRDCIVDVVCCLGLRSVKTDTSTV